MVVDLSLSGKSWFGSVGGHNDADVGGSLRREHSRFLADSGRSGNAGATSLAASETNRGIAETPSVGVGSTGPAVLSHRGSITSPPRWLRHQTDWSGPQARTGTGNDSPNPLQTSRIKYTTTIRTADLFPFRRLKIACAGGIIPVDCERDHP